MIVQCFFHISLGCPKGDAMRKAWVVMFALHVCCLHACAHEPKNEITQILSCPALFAPGFPTIWDPEPRSGANHGLQLFHDSLGWHRDMFGHRMLDQIVMP